MLEIFALDELLRNAATAQRLRLERALRPCDLSPAQFEALRHLNARESMSGAELARLSALSPQTIGVVIENLEKKSFVRRNADANNLRIRRIYITDAGALALKTALLCAANAIGPPLLNAAGAEEASAAVRFLTKLLASKR